MFCKPQGGGISRAFYCAALGLKFFDTPGPGALPQALISRPFRAKKRFRGLAILVAAVGGAKFVRNVQSWRSCVEQGRRGGGGLECHFDLAAI